EWMNGQHLKRLSEEERVRRVDAFLAARGYDPAAHPPEWRALLVRAIGDRLKTLADAEGYGRFALREALEVDPEAWATLREKPEGSGRFGALGRPDRRRVGTGSEGGGPGATRRRKAACRACGPLLDCVATSYCPVV